MNEYHTVKTPNFQGSSVIRRQFLGIRTSWLPPASFSLVFQPIFIVAYDFKIVSDFENVDVIKYVCKQKHKLKPMQTKEQDRFTVGEIAKALGVANSQVHYLRRELRIDPDGTTDTQARAFLFLPQHVKMMNLALQMKKAKFPFIRIREIVQVLENHDLTKSVIVSQTDEYNEVITATSDFTKTMLEVMGDDTTKTLHSFKLDDGVVVGVAS
jgi:DNA-binding transcriptional MerR regulator